MTLIHRPLAKTTKGRKCLAAGTRRAASALERIHVTTDRRLGDQSHMEWYASWLRSQPGHKVTHGGQVCGDRFGITSRESSSKLLECSRIIASRGHLSFPNFEPKRFSDKNLA